MNEKSILKVKVLEDEIKWISGFYFIPHFFAFFPLRIVFFTSDADYFFCSGSPLRSDYFFTPDYIFYLRSALSNSDIERSLCFSAFKNCSAFQNYYTVGSPCSGPAIRLEIEASRVATSGGTTLFLSTFYLSYFLTLIASLSFDCSRLICNCNLGFSSDLRSEKGQLEFLEAAATVEAINLKLGRIQRERCRWRGVSSSCLNPIRWRWRGAVLHLP